MPLNFETFIHPQKFLFSTFYANKAKEVQVLLIMEIQLSSVDDGDHVLVGQSSQQNYKDAKYIYTRIQKENIRKIQNANNKLEK